MRILSLIVSLSPQWMAINVETCHEYDVQRNIPVWFTLTKKKKTKQTRNVRFCLIRESSVSIISFDSNHFQQKS